MGEKKIGEQREPRGSWGGGKGGALSPSPGRCLAHFARLYFPYLTFFFLPFSPTAEPGPRLF